MSNSILRARSGKAIRTLALLSVAALVAVGCKPKEEAKDSSAASQGELHLYIWSEYIDTQTVKDFEAENHCKVVIDLFESNEQMIAKLQAGGLSQYDVVVPSGFVIPSMVQLGLLQKLDHSKIPNLKNLKPMFQREMFDSGNVYSATYQWGTVGLVYNKKMLPDFKPSWASVFKSSAKSPFIFLDAEREMLGSALKFLGKSVNTLDKANLEAASKVLLEAKKSPNFLGFEADVGGKNKVVAGTAAVAVAFNGDGVKGMNENKDLLFVNPIEGGVLWADNLAIPAKAPNAELAHKFINHILAAKIGAQLSNYTQYATPNAAAMPFIDTAALKNPAIYPDSVTLAKFEGVTDLGKDGRLYSETWKIVKSR